MLKNYFKIALRNLAKHKGYASINIFGLAVGIGCCLLIFLYVKDELTYDRFQSKADRIYRINSLVDWFGNKDLMGATSGVEGPAYAERIPEIEAFTRFRSTSLVIQKGEEWLQQYRTIYADADVFNIFDFEILSGSTSGGFDELNSIVIERSVAEKFFGKVDVAGEELRIKLDGDIETFIVQAVFEDYPENSSLSGEVYLSWEKFSSKNVNDSQLTSWSSIGLTTILLTKEPLADLTVLESKLREVRLSMNPDEEEDKWARGIESQLQPLSAVHLSKGVGGSAGLKNASAPTYSYILSGIGLLILILACINFANLSVARSIPRAKEIGMRKVLGAGKKQLAWQFLGEAFYVSMFSFVLGMILAELFQPTFGQLTNKTFGTSIFEDGTLIAGCFILVCLSALLAGAYPAFFVARFSILKSLSGKVKLSGKQYLTKGLVLFQFAIAAVLVIGTIGMNQQIGFLLNTDLGYDDKNMATVYLGGNSDQGTVFLNEITKNPNILEVSLNSGFSSATSMGFGDVESFVAYSPVDTNFLSVMGLELLEGRNLKPNSDRYVYGKDTLTNLLVSQEFVRKMKIEGDPIGTIIHSGGDEKKNEYRIVGVFNDFIYSSAKSGLSPVAMPAGKINGLGMVRANIKYQEGFESELEEVLSAAWKKIDPYTPFSFSFMEEQNRNTYFQEKRWRSIITSASVIAIIISCLGLFGMAHLSAQQRQKEIGVRKVLGASVGQLIYMLNLSFTKLVAISTLIAIPVAYYFLDDWLSGFANRIELGLLVFAIPTAITLFIALFTVSIQSFRTANSNPVNSLRSE